MRMIGNEKKSCPMNTSTKFISENIEQKINYLENKEKLASKTNNLFI